MKQKKRNRLTFEKYEKKIREKMEKSEECFKQGKYGGIVSWKMNKSKLAGYKIGLILKNGEFVRWLQYMKRRYKKEKAVPLETIKEKVMELCEEKMRLQERVR